MRGQEIKNCFEDFMPNDTMRNRKFIDRDVIYLLVNKNAIKVDELILNLITIFIGD